MSNNTIIEIQNLAKSFPTEESGKIEILRDINLTINEKEFVIIYGPSGSGKSTLLHQIIGLETPTSGKVFVHNTDITKLNSEQRSILRAKNFGMVYQSWYWAKSCNVWENVALPIYIAGAGDQVAKKKALEALASIDMTKYANKRPMQLSGGEQQKIGLARAIVQNPFIIVADEPTGNLDTHSADQVMQFLQNLNIHSKRTIIMVTHNLSYLPMATKTIALRDGQIVSSGSEGVKEQIRQELKGVI